jgi:LmbE family N-acetylglucosaminyl deacetylase
MVNINREVQPDVVLTPASGDFHQDHAVIAAEGLRAFKRTRILGYEIPWNHQSFPSSFFVRLSREDADSKARALNEYKSQAHRSYVSATAVEATLRYRGLQAGSEFAEAFEMIRWYM